MTQTRESRFKNAAKRTADLMVQAAEDDPKTWQEIQIQPPVAAVKYQGPGVFAVMSQDGGDWSEYPTAEAASEALQADWLGFYQTQNGYRGALEKTMREKARALGYSPGGANHVTRPNDKRLQGKGRKVYGVRVLPQRVRLTPFYQTRAKSETVSIAVLQIARCNMCGVWDIAEYTETLLTPDGAKGIEAMNSYPAQPARHRPQCDRYTGPAEGEDEAAEGDAPNLHGPIPQVFDLKLLPDKTPKGANASYVTLIVKRCNACGATGHYDYTESIRSWDGRGKPKERSYKGQPPVHAPDCPCKGL